MTKNEMLKFKLDEAGFVLGYPTNESDAIKLGNAFWLSNDFYSACGGYKLVKIYVDSHGVSAFAKDTRLKYSEYLTYLQGIIDGARLTCK